jgi:hypothetical protein
MTQQAVEYLRDPHMWLDDGAIELELATADPVLHRRAQSYRPSDVPPVATFGPPRGWDRLPVAEVEEVI